MLVAIGRGVPPGGIHLVCDVSKVVSLGLRTFFVRRAGVALAGAVSLK